MSDWEVRLESLSDAPLLISAAIYGALGKGLEGSDLVDSISPALDQVRWVAEVARREIVELRETVRQREAWRQKAIYDAERKIEKALAEAQVIAIREDGFSPQGWFVYLLWGHDEQCPLYVGKSGNVLARLGSHMGDRRKGAAVSRVTLVECKTADLMDETEMRLIGRYQPPWNTIGINVDRQPLPEALPVREKGGFRRSSWGSVRRLPSGRYQARYMRHGVPVVAPQTFESRKEASLWLDCERTDLMRAEVSA